MSDNKKLKQNVKKVKKNKQKQKQKQKQQQSNKQTIKLNITTSGGGGGSGGASQTKQPQTIPTSFVNEEHTTLLKSINEQLKKKNEPATTTTQTQEIPLQISEELTPPIQLREEEQTSVNVVAKNKKDGIPPQFREKIPPPPIFSPKLAEKIPIVNKERDTTRLNLMEQINKADNKNLRTEEQIEEANQPLEQQEGYGLKQSGDEPKEQAEKKKLGRKPNSEEYKEQKKLENKENRLKNNKQVSEQAFIRLLTKVDDPQEYQRLTDLFNSNQLPTKTLKNKLASYGFSKEKIDEMYKGLR